MIDAAWRETAEFRLVGEAEDEMWVEHAAFAGKVNVTAPQGLVRAERLELTFDPPDPEARRDGTAHDTGRDTTRDRNPTRGSRSRAPGDSSPNLPPDRRHRQRVLRADRRGEREAAGRMPAADARHCPVGDG